MADSQTPRPEILYSVKAQRGPSLRCKGWKQETLLRMLENNMENAEKPEELVIYGGIGKCARNWESYHAIVKALKETGTPLNVVNIRDFGPDEHNLVMRLQNRVGVLVNILNELREEGINVEEMGNSIFEGGKVACCTLLLDGSPSKELLARVNAGDGVIQAVLK